jgi:hypothetical protein
MDDPSMVVRMLTGDYKFNLTFDQEMNYHHGQYWPLSIYQYLFKFTFVSNEDDISHKNYVNKMDINSFGRSGDKSDVKDRELYVTKT